MYETGITYYSRIKFTCRDEETHVPATVYLWATGFAYAERVRVYDGQIWCLSPDMGSESFTVFCTADAKSVKEHFRDNGIRVGEDTATPYYLTRYTDGVAKEWIHAHVGEKFTHVCALGGGVK